MNIARRSLVWLVGLWLLGGGLVAAQEPGARVSTPAGEITVIADRLEEIGPDGLLVATGNVEVTRGRVRLLADRVELDRDTGDAAATGRVTLFDGEDRVSGQRIDYNFRTGTGVIHEADARAAPYYRLSGERMERLDESVYRVERGIFTTCEADPPPWFVRFGSAVADLEDFLWGRNASFWAAGVPLIPWLPVFAAPIGRERQTGFLIPKIGVSSRKGFAAEIPFYWAISDSQDLTVAPLLYTSRGFGANVEYRYRLAVDHAGSARAFILKETEVDGDERGWANVRHFWGIRPGLSLRADVKGVTDDDVFRDYGHTIHQRGEQRVQSNIFLTQRWPTWLFVADLFWYQDLTTRRPVELHRLPELSLMSVSRPVPGIPGLLWDLDAGFVRFVREVGSDGTRLDVRPRLSYPLPIANLLTVTPFVAGRLTAYDRRVTGQRLDLDGRPLETTVDDLRLRRLVEAGVDLTTIASRVYPLGGWRGLDAVLHSVEPRVTYVYVDGHTLDQLPAWTELERLQPAHRIEYAVTNRLRLRTVAPLGSEALRLEALRLILGHSIDLRDGARRSGDVVADLLLQTTGRLRFRGTLQYDTQGAGLQRGIADMTLVVPRVTTTLGVRYDSPGQVLFFQGAVVASLARGLQGRASTNWDARTATAVENRVGLDFQYQCWGVTVEGIQRSRGGTEIVVAVNLLGLGAPITTSIGLGSLTPGGGIR